jgi:thioredoxin-like negative regulator of GroEL
MKFYKFYADWCGPCKVLTTNLEKAGIEYEAINADTNEEMCQKFGVSNLPTFIAVDDDENILDRFTGIKTPIAIKEWVESLNE